MNGRWLGVGLKQLFLRGKGRSWVLTGVVNMRHGEQFHSYLFITTKVHKNNAKINTYKHSLWLCVICRDNRQHGRPHIGANGVSWPPKKMNEKLKSKNMQKRAGTCRERPYGDHIFIPIYFRMHHFIVKFSKFSSPQATRGIDPP